MAADLAVGDMVEVRVGYDNSWTNGFEVVAVLNGGYQLRRCSDGKMLPAPTSPGDVRAL